MFRLPSGPGPIFPDDEEKIRLRVGKEHRLPQFRTFDMLNGSLDPTDSTSDFLLEFDHDPGSVCSQERLS